MTVAISVVPERLTELPPLGAGAHEGIESGCCVMEAVAYVAGEPWSDAPECACPVIAAFLRSWNDSLPNGQRDTLLRPLVLDLVGTRADEATERRRAWLAIDWMIRTFVPTWLRAAGLTEQAEALSTLPEIATDADIAAAQPLLEAARDRSAAAWGAASAAAATAAARAATATASAAARSTVRATTWGAAAGATVRATTWATVRVTTAASAAWDTTWDAAWAALQPVVTELQASALDLVRRMIAVTAAADPAPVI